DRNVTGVQTCALPIFERRTKLVRNLRKAGLGRKSVPRQCRRPAPRQSALSQTPEGLLAAALPVAAVDMDQTWGLGIRCRINVPRSEEHTSELQSRFDL